MFSSARNLLCGAVLVVFATGCATSIKADRFRDQVAQEASMYMPRELDKVTLSDYRVEPPDILLIEAVNSIRKADAPLEVGDTVFVRVQNGLPLDPPTDPEISSLQYNLELSLEFEFKSINGQYTIGADGKVDFGPAYGTIAIAGMTLDDAETAVKKFLRDDVGLKAPQVSVNLPNLGGKQVVAGEHLVRPDGKVSLGVYGQVDVAGKTIPEVKSIVETHLNEFLNKPVVNVDVLAYNSKVYYVITDGGGFGEQVVRLPFTGNETVLDAISNIQGLSQVSSKKIWIARPSPSNNCNSQILDVHWSEIAAEGMTATNYQLFPGDRIYIEADRLIRLDNVISKVFSPVERVFGVILLGNGLVRNLQGQQGFGNGF